MESLWTSSPTQKLMDDDMGLVSCDVRTHSACGSGVASTSDANPRLSQEASPSIVSISHGVNSQLMTKPEMNRNVT